MEIRLTCPGCNKRYRLPGTAVGYFKCRRCELVMPIPETSPFGQAAAADVRSHRKPAAFVKKPVRTMRDHLRLAVESGSCVAALACLALGIWLITGPATTSPDRGFVYLPGGILSGLLATGLFGFGLKRIGWLSWPGAIFSGLIISGCFLMVVLSGKSGTDGQQRSATGPETVGVESIEAGASGARPETGNPL